MEAETEHRVLINHRLVAAAAAEAVITAVEEEAAWAIDSKGNSEQQYQRFGKEMICQGLAS